MPLPIVQFKGFLCYAALSEKDPTTCCMWPCSAERMPLYDVPPESLSIFTRVGLDKLGPEHRDELIRWAHSMGATKTEREGEEDFEEGEEYGDPVPPGIDISPPGITTN